MSREIKFRGQQINTKKWVYGYLYRNKGLYVICENIRYAEEEPIFLDTIGQYTGLHDKNGKEIWENDIVEITREGIYETIYEKGIIIFKNGCFFIKSKKTLLALYNCELNNYKVKVIGNITDNPELLGGE